MGKSLTGKELGTGLSQRKDGTYSARILANGKREEKYFKKLTDARRWLNEAHYKKDTGDPVLPDTTVDGWYDFWEKNIICNRAPNTIRNYRERYDKNISPVIGAMRLKDVRPMHCSVIFKQMEEHGYAGSTMRQAYICISAFFGSAVENGKAASVPLNGIRITKPVKAADDIRFLTSDEQSEFLKAAAATHNYAPYAFVLETGLRCGELVGLAWQDIDWERHLLTVRRTLEYRYKTKAWRAGPPKSVGSYRTIPLTQRAEQILRSVYASRHIPKVTDELEYTDRRTGKSATVCMKDIVFINFRTGEPTKNSTYDTFLLKVCRSAGIKPFSMHALRHTFATRAIERGVQPKVLQKILGHSSLRMTMDRYVHVTEDSLAEAFRLFESAI